MSKKDKILEPTALGKVIEQQAMRGSIYGMYLLGMYYLNGQEGYTKDIVQAVDWLSQAASQNHLGAIKELAKLYGEGTLIERDVHKSLMFWKMAAEAGDKIASFALGKRFFYGVGGLKQNLEKGIYYLDLASTQGSLEASYLLGQYYLDQNSQDKKSVAYKKAIGYLTNAGKNGHGKSLQLLSKLGIKVQVEEHCQLDA
jgi:TPR repeat protein